MLGARGAAELVEESQLVEERKELQSSRRDANEITPLIGESRSRDFEDAGLDENQQDDNGDDYYYDTIGSSMSCDQREALLLDDDEDEVEDNGSGESNAGPPLARARRPRDLNGITRVKHDNEDTETIGSSQSGEQTEKKKRKWPKVPKVPKNLQKMPKLKLRKLKLPKLAGTADTNIRECNEFTAPLMAAAKQGHLQEVQRLVKIGHDVNIREPDDTTPLMYAAEYGHPR